MSKYFPQRPVLACAQRCPSVTNVTFILCLLRKQAMSTTSLSFLTLGTASLHPMQLIHK